MVSPSNPPKLPDLARLAQESGLDKNVVTFLKDTGVNTSGVLYHLFSKRERIAKTLQPLETGVTVQGRSIKLDVAAMGIAIAVLEHMVDQIELARNAQFASVSAVPAPTTAITPSTSTTDEQKAPKTLPKGYWATVIQEYEKEMVAGVNRSFPSHQLVGAEEVLARMVHERQVSHLFTPVRLKEIISTRHFTPSKQVNPRAKGAEDRAERLSLGSDGQFVKQQQAIPEPQRMLTVLDAFDSIRWAMIFARWGQEHQINALIEFFANLTRDHPNKIPQIREYYKKTSWDLAMHMRSGGNFGEGVDKIVKSLEKHDALARWLPADQPKGKGKEGKGFKGSYKDLGKDLWLGGLGKGKGRFFAPAYGSVQTQVHQPAPGPYTRPPCRLWQQGHCKFGLHRTQPRWPCLLLANKDSSGRSVCRTGRHLP